MGFRWEKHLHRILWNLSIWRWLAAFFLNHLHLKPIQTNTSCINVWGDHFSYHSYDQKGVPNRGWFLTIGSAFGSLTVASFTHRSWKTRHRSVWHQRGKKGIWFACTHTDTYTYIYIYIYTHITHRMGIYLDLLEADVLSHLNHTKILWWGNSSQLFSGTRKKHP